MCTRVCASDGFLDSRGKHSGSLGRGRHFAEAYGTEKRLRGFGLLLALFASLGVCTFGVDLVGNIVVGGDAKPAASPRRKGRGCRQAQRDAALGHKLVRDRIHFCVYLPTDTLKLFNVCTLPHFVARPMRQRRVHVLLRDVVFSDDGIPRLKCQIRAASTMAASDDTEHEPVNEPDFAPERVPSPASPLPTSSVGPSEPSVAASPSTSYASCDSRDDGDSQNTLRQRLARIDALVSRTHRRCEIALLDSGLRRTSPPPRESPVQLTP